MMRKTLKNAISCTSVGLHSGRKILMTLNPAPAKTGVLFKRTDVEGKGATIPALWNNSRVSQLCTTLACPDTGATIGTIEHLMAALMAMEIDDVIVEVNGPEVPAMDGSSAPFVFLIECAGTVDQDAPRMAIQVVKPVTVQKGDTMATLAPFASTSGARFVVDFEIDFPVEAIGRQACTIPVTAASFKDSVMRARTFGLVDDLPKMRQAGLGLGGSLDNAVVVNGAEIMNEGGLRYQDEFVRHKALDAIGDLALAGMPILGRYSGYKSSHALNGQLVQALLADPSAFKLVPYGEAREGSDEGLYEVSEGMRASA